ncbi:hypothetical protein G1H11_15590 [Phytoactinopolyspora alkaliphila]|uniref:DUF5808 domain-containing protein n=1 Tax=Phytoactinopolyspora alkaliphila TaxID=1783498 RepID=A0A6N9YP06_9ACTN|nr:DUF5808 domain-containing protein [Phytoactinopolyspora alkaliphila]NED96733.1 hypothetical protein [Phytoactinopolyspora alkaliphila]
MKKSSTIIGLGAVAAVGAAVASELRKPAEERTWQGKLGGVVPYDFRPPTTDRLRERMWAPDDDAIVKPHVFGVGWTVNVGRLARKAGVA